MSDRLLELLDETAQQRVRALPTAPDPVGRVDAAVRKDRTRRAAAAAAGTALSVVLVLLVVVGAVPRLTADPAPPATSDPAFPAVVRTVNFDGQPWPVAGSLATDAAFVHRVESEMTRQTPNGAGGNVPPTVLFAGDFADFRIVVARNAPGYVWVASGPRGADVDALEGLAGPAFDTTNPPAITVLVPNGTTTAQLLALAPPGVAVEAATAPAVWPQEAPTYAPVPLKDGVGVKDLVARAPFRLSMTSVPSRAVAAGWQAPITTYDIEDIDRALTAEEKVAVQAREDARTRFFTSPAVVDDLFAQGVGDMAMGFASFEVGDAEISLAARDELPGSVDAIVGQAVHAGVRSRVLSVTWGKDPNNNSGSHGAQLSVVSEVDPRPLVARENKGAGGRTMLWCAVPGATIVYRSTAVDSGGPEHQVSVDGKGFAIVQSDQEVVAVAVLDADGHELWRIPDE